MARVDKYFNQIEPWILDQASKMGVLKNDYNSEVILFNGSLMEFCRELEREIIANIAANESHKDLYLKDLTNRLLTISEKYFNQLMTLKDFKIKSTKIRASLMKSFAYSAEFDEMYDAESVYNNCTGLLKVIRSQIEQTFKNYIVDDPNSTSAASIYIPGIKVNHLYLLTRAVNDYLKIAKHDIELKELSQIASQTFKSKKGLNFSPNTISNANMNGLKSIDDDIDNIVTFLDALKGILLKEKKKEIPFK